MFKNKTGGVIIFWKILNTPFKIILYKFQVMGVFYLAPNNITLYLQVKYRIQVFYANV